MALEIVSTEHASDTSQAHPDWLMRRRNRIPPRRRIQIVSYSRIRADGLDAQLLKSVHLEAGPVAVEGLVSVHEHEQ